MFSLDPAVFTSRATISLGALEQNLTRVRAHLTGQKIMAVIKGDAYGHGLLPAARAFARERTTWGLPKLPKRSRWSGNGGSSLPKVKH
ncbi:alanine racemase [Actinotignum sp. GS-2025f]|uniref:alanine racemase n=1 Tax=unclassified Actinotignum TaxID=2632702 RepID=UPI003F44ED50